MYTCWLACESGTVSQAVSSHIYIIYHTIRLVSLGWLSFALGWDSDPKSWEPWASHCGVRRRDMVINAKVCAVQVYRLQLTALPTCRSTQPHPRLTPCRGFSFLLLLLSVYLDISNSHKRGVTQQTTTRRRRRHGSVGLNSRCSVARGRARSGFLDRQTAAAASSEQ